MKKIVLLLLLSLFVFLNLGKWIDVTTKPVKSDVIVCLGGGTLERVKKSISLIKEGYAKQNNFLMIGESWYNLPYIKKNYPDLSIQIEESPQNTEEEMKFIREYTKEHRYKSVLIVTDAPHSARVSLLMSIISVEYKENVNYRVVESGVKWWNKDTYYKNTRARSFVWYESIRIFYHLLFDSWVLINIKHSVKA